MRGGGGPLSGCAGPRYVAFFVYASFILLWRCAMAAARRPPERSACTPASPMGLSSGAHRRHPRLWPALAESRCAGARYLTDAVFPFYIVHQTTIIATDYAIRDLGLPAWGEAAVVIAATVASCVLAYEIVRRVWWLRPLFGLKREPRSGLRPRTPERARGVGRPRIARMADPAFNLPAAIDAIALDEGVVQNEG